MTRFSSTKTVTSIPVEYSTTPVFKAGSLAGTVIVYRDIRERKLAEERLQLANFLADIALELTDGGYWHVDLILERDFVCENE